MLSNSSQPNAIANHDDDFTVDNYRGLLRLARAGWPLVGYDEIPFGQRFLLWRHDCDYSLNRALRLARVEHEEGVRATYFINPHCEFYNFLERSQLDIVRELLTLGHAVGLHFDGMFYTTRDEAELEAQLNQEVDLLERALGHRPTAFSFHNPSTFHLSCEKERYAGMMNCYSSRFKTEISYCSDSNGYWRFRRLHDVLEQASDPFLQVLTHPGWWQDEPMTPRQRVFHCVYGRAAATIRFFDDAIEAGGRKNPAGARHELSFLRGINEESYVLLDYLLHSRQYPELLVASWRLMVRQVLRLCEVKAQGRDSPHPEIFPSSSAALYELDAESSAWERFESVFGIVWLDASGCSSEEMRSLQQEVVQVLRGVDGSADGHLERSSLRVLECIKALASWSQTHAFAHERLTSIDERK